MLPIPATFVVGTDGIVKARFVDPDYRKRMEIDELFVALRSACAAASPARPPPTMAMLQFDAMFPPDRAD